MAQRQLAQRQLLLPHTPSKRAHEGPEGFTRTPRQYLVALLPPPLLLGGLDELGLAPAPGRGALAGVADLGVRS